MSTIRLELKENCKSTTNEDVLATDLVTLAAPEQDAVGPSSGTGFMAVMTGAGSAPAGTFICQLNVIGTPEGEDEQPLKSAQFYVQIAT